MSVVGVLGAALALPASGCSGCDDIGCADQYVSVGLGEFDADVFPVAITLCIDDACTTRTEGGPIESDGLTAFALWAEAPIVEIGGAAPLAEGEPVEVRVSAVIADGTTVIDAAGTFEPQRYRATERCGPYCTNVGATYDPATGELRG